MQLKTGTYTGNGSSRSITGLGFQPDAVFVKGASARAMYLSMSGMASTKSVSLDGLQTYSTTAITSRDADGFSLGTDAVANANAETFYWIAVRNDGAGDFVTGTYTGNAVDNRSITGVGFQPEVVMVVGIGDDSGGDNMYVSTSALVAGGNAFRFAGVAGLQANEIQQFEADGFQIGNDGGVNGSGRLFGYLAFKASAGYVETGTYTGNGTDNRDITNSGAFQPDWAIVKKDSSEGVHKPGALAGDSSLYASATASSSNRIQAINSNGFQVGTDAEVNTASGSPTYYWINLKGAAVTPPAATNNPAFLLNFA